MNDSELRNQHARHYAGHGYAVGIKNESFKAGWNAARAQEPMIIYKLEKELDQLRAEIKQLKSEKGTKNE